MVIPQNRIISGNIFHATGALRIASKVVFGKVK